jgi:chromosome segregation ATPase
MSDSFIDLRYGSDAGRVSDNFWPSFTDIMMVVVMIFLITSTVLILRNWELVAELRATMEAERQAAAVARSATEASASLEDQLAQAEHAVSVLRMQLMQASERNQAQTRELAEREQKQLALQSELSTVKGNLQVASRETQTLREELKASDSRIKQVRDDYAKQATRLQTALSALTTLETRYATQTAELGQLRQESAKAQQILAELQGEYTSLRVKYDKLVRPARTAQGKHVVEVRYEKTANDYRIGFKDASGSTYASINRAELHKRLSALKRKYPDKLYVKIVIPENSGLSYSEAWNFTVDTLRKYDYYHQE